MIVKRIIYKEPDYDSPDGNVSFRPGPILEILYMPIIWTLKKQLHEN